MEPYDLNNVLQNYINISHENNSQEICCICQDIVDNGDQVYELPECNHIFHTNCIVTWFRAQNTSCPLCANPGINNNNDRQTRKDYGYFGGWNSAKRKMGSGKYKRIVKSMANPECPKELLRLHKSLCKNIDTIKILKKEHDEFKRFQKQEMSYKMAIKETESRLRKMRSLGMKIYKQIENIIEYPIVPIIIPSRQ